MQAPKSVRSPLKVVKYSKRADFDLKFKIAARNILSLKQRCQYYKSKRAYLGTDLVTALTGLEVNNFPHICRFKKEKFG